MYKIESAKSYKYSNTLHLQFILEVLGLIKKFGIEWLKIIDLFNIYNACVEEEDLYYKTVRKSYLSGKKQEISNLRNTLVLGIHHALKSGLRHFDENIRAAAQKLELVFDTYNSPVLITRLPYDAETAVINNLLQELTVKYADDSQKINLIPWLVELQNRNNEFDALVKDYNEEQAGIPPLNLVNIRKKTDSAYRDIVTFINALVVVEKTSTYDPFIVEINTLIKHYNDLYAQHIGRIRAGKGKDDTMDNEEN
jgi:hypothetical protein